ncbi:MAG: peptidylprolyl isomerase [Lachnospiraceae bacterium]|nr:peptidylprolyl isomerase [Lachnospiraceae bacterium]
MRYKKTAAFLLAGAVAASLVLGGCGSTINSDAIVATCGDQEISLGYLNFVAHYNQAIYDYMIGTYSGTDYWTSELYYDDNGDSMETSVKNAIMEEVETDCLLEQHMPDYGVEITAEETEEMQTAAEDFMAENTKEGIKAMGATEEYVQEMLYYETVKARMQEAIEADVGNDLDPEDYKQRTFSYVQVSLNGYYDEDGSYVEYTDEEVVGLEVDAQLFAESAKEDFDQAVEDYGGTIYTYSYGEDEAGEDEGGFCEAVIEEADKMHVGDVAGPIEGDGYLYIIRLDSEDDEEATEAAVETAEGEVKTEYYNEVVDGYMEDSDFSYDESLWEKVKFTDLFDVTYSDEDEAVEE